MNFWNKIQSTILFLKLVKDPTRTDRIIKGIKIVSQDKDQEPVKAVVKHILSHPGFKAMYEEDYMPETPSLAALSKLPADTFGFAVYQHMNKNGINFDIFPREHRGPVVEYLSARIYQDHDLWHVLLNRSVEVEDELAVQAFGVAQLQSPIAIAIIAGGLLHLLSKKPARAVDALKRIVESYTLGQKAPFLLSYRLHDLFDKPLSQVQEFCCLRSTINSLESNSALHF